MLFSLTFRFLSYKIDYICIFLLVNGGDDLKHTFHSSSFLDYLSRWSNLLFQSILSIILLYQIICTKAVNFYNVFLEAIKKSYSCLEKNPDSIYEQIVHDYSGQIFIYARICEQTHKPLNDTLQNNNLVVIHIFHYFHHLLKAQS